MHSTSLRTSLDVAHNDRGIEPMTDLADGNTMRELRTPEPDSERQAFASESRTIIESAIEALPGYYRVVFVMREVEGMSTAETAACLGIAEETAKTRLHRARALFSEALYRRAVLSGAAFAFHSSRCDRVVQVVLKRIESIDPANRVLLRGR